MIKEKISKLIEGDELRPEYALSKLKGRVRAKYATAMAHSYSVTVHHPDGTKTGKTVGRAGVFSRFTAVNQALRVLVRIADKRVKKPA